jgi:hypothetical protein
VLLPLKPESWLGKTEIRATMMKKVLIGLQPGTVMRDNLRAALPNIKITALESTVGAPLRVFRVTLRL